MLLDSKSNDFRLQEQCFQTLRTMLWTLQSSALDLMEQCSVSYGAMLYIPIETCSVRYRARLQLLQSIAIVGKSELVFVLINVLDVVDESL